MLERRKYGRMIVCNLQGGGWRTTSPGGEAYPKQGIPGHSGIGISDIRRAENVVRDLDKNEYGNAA